LQSSQASVTFTRLSDAISVCLSQRLFEDFGDAAGTHGTATFTDREP
jgi:hypothetical protein